MARRDRDVVDLRIRDIAYGHTPDKRGRRKDRYAHEPITVRKRLFGGYKVIDGNDRLYYAAQDGRRTIEARVVR